MSEEAEKKTAGGVSVERAYAAVMQALKDERALLEVHYKDCFKYGLSGTIRMLDESKMKMLDKIIKAGECGASDGATHEKVEAAQNDELDELLSVIDDGLLAANVLIENYKREVPITREPYSGMRILQVNKAAARLHEFREKRNAGAATV